ncbi:GNAT family N-acetyltransferase, partial [Mycobacterium tuberculosis]|nr:GNAT family N-acetyltransferase [Mycobacterium tuberculosis]
MTGEDARAHIFVASQQEELVGYFSLTIDYSLWRDHSWAHLDCLYVTPNERGQGVGAGLLAEAVAVARRLGADQL